MKADLSGPTLIKAYAVVPSNDDNDVVAAEVTPVEFNKLMAPCCDHRVASEFQHIPGTGGLVWEDEFFDGEDKGEIVAVFDLDYDLMEAHYSKVGWSCLAGTMLFPNIFTIALFGLVPCYLNRNVHWNVRAQHIAITRDGIRFVHDRRPTCWGKSCTDAGKNSKTIPFDKITDCDIVEPAGNTCCWIENKLSSVHVDTASSEQKSHELSIDGLREPDKFKKLVWAMKRAYHPATATLGNSMEMLGRGSRSDSGEDVAVLLRDIRDELRRNNEMIQQHQINSNAQTTPPSAPLEID